jgi:hypothetical protein
MKHRYEQLGKLSLANMLRARHVRQWLRPIEKEAADESESSRLTDWSLVTIPPFTASLCD